MGVLCVCSTICAHTLLQSEQIHELAVQVGEKVAKAEALGELRQTVHVPCIYPEIPVV